jgi:hypothetical protein
VVVAVATEMVQIRDWLQGAQLSTQRTRSTSRASTKPRVGIARGGGEGDGGRAAGVLGESVRLGSR